MNTTFIIISTVVIFLLLFAFVAEKRQQKNVDATDKVIADSPVVRLMKIGAEGYVLAPAIPDHRIPGGYAVVDLETTGLDPSKDQITEIAAVLIDGDGKIHSEIETFIRISGEIPEYITVLTGITNEDVQTHGIPEWEALSRLFCFIGNYPVIAFNADFDMGFLRAAASRQKMDFPIKEVRCALEAARRAWPILKSHRLSALCALEHLGPQIHRALDDCKKTAIIFNSAQKIIDKGKPVYSFDMGELTASKIDIEQWHQLIVGDILKLWTKHHMDVMNAYVTGKPMGTGPVLAIDKGNCHPGIEQALHERKLVILTVKDILPDGTVSLILSMPEKIPKKPRRSKKTVESKPNS